MTTPINNEELRQAIETMGSRMGRFPHEKTVLAAAKRLLDEGEKCAVLQSQVDNADVTLQQQKLCTASLRQQLDAEKTKSKWWMDQCQLRETKLQEYERDNVALTTANQRLREALEATRNGVVSAVAGKLTMEKAVEIDRLGVDALSQTHEATDEGKDLLKDKARLDWLEKRKRVVPGGWYGRKGDAAEWENPSASWGLTHSMNEGTYTIPDELKQLTLRQAIDQAIAKRRTGDE